ncbi:MAG: hypothetical protein WCW47_01740 [Candidatus Paceibacterota bacterium]|jgi:hypothetical protein
MRKSYKIQYLTLPIFLFPTFAFADFSLGVNTPSKFGDFIIYLKSITDLLIPILSALAFIVFFWGVSKFILNSNKPEEIKNGRNYMMWGILVLFILLTFKTIIGLVSNDLGIGSKTPNPNNILLPTP